MSEAFLPRGPQYHPLLAIKRPETVEAWYWDGEDKTADALCEWVNSASGGHTADKHPHENLIVIDAKQPPSLSVAPLKPGEVLVRDRFGDFWPLPADVFRAAYQSTH